MKRILLAIGCILLTCLASFAQIKVACVGNSITYGYGIENRDTNSYPAQLGRILGSEWDVKNFGVSGATLLKKGDYTYWNLEAFKNAKGYNPDVVIIKLGTNDTKPQNWKLSNEFASDYLAMINEFRALPSKPYIIVCLPVPAYPERWGIRDSVIVNGVIPLVKQVASQSNAILIDLYTPLSNHPEWFPDKIHPNAEGAGQMAKAISEKLLELKKDKLVVKDNRQK